jgi:hypothetical protein
MIDSLRDSAEMVVSSIHAACVPPTFIWTTQESLANLHHCDSPIKLNWLTPEVQNLNRKISPILSRLTDLSFEAF